jgi:sulfotransferase family protein
MVVGAHKAGSTSLYRYLAQHPAILSHPQSEMSFFLNDHEFEEGFGRAGSRYFGVDVEGSGVRIAKHVMLMYSATAVQRLHDHNPRARLVVVLRHPVSRAYSAFWYARRMGWEPISSFEAALAAEPGRLREGWLRWRSCAYVHNGKYLPHVRRLLETHGPENVRLLLTEDLIKAGPKLYQEFFSFLQVDPSFGVQTAVRHNPAVQARSSLAARWVGRFLAPGNRLRRVIRKALPDSLAYRARHALLRLNEREFTPPPMAEATRRRLLEEFAPENHALAALLGRDLSAWER